MTLIEVVAFLTILGCLQPTRSAVPCPATTGSRDRCGPQASSSASSFQYSSNCICQPGLCCSSQGYCGPSSPSPASTDSQSDYCGQGCQPKYGACANSTFPTCPANLDFEPSFAVGTLTTEIARGILLPTAIRTQCCPLASPIKSWTIAGTDNLTGYFLDYSGVYVGKISATCSDGTELPSVTYGLASNGQCKTTRLNNETTVPAISGGDTYTYRSGGLLDSFLGVGGDGGFLASLSCPTQTAADTGPLTTQVAIGFQAASSCYGISSFRVICAAAPT